MDITPSPVRTCPFGSHSQPSAIVGGAPSQPTVCTSRCALFIMQTGPDGKPAGGSCAFVFSALALVNLEQRDRALLEVQSNGGKPPPAPTKQ